MSRADRLRVFLSRLEGKPVVWGRDDCSAAPALWWSEETGIPVRLPVYSSKEEADAIRNRMGGLSEAWQQVADQVGAVERFWTLQSPPEVGDVGIVRTRLYGEIGGICGAGGILIVRKDNGGWHPFGPVREYVKVFATP